MLKRSLTEDAQEVFRAIALIELGARMQVLESELTLSRDRMIRLYREVKGVSPPKGMLPFSADWYMTWLPQTPPSRVSQHVSVPEEGSALLAPRRADQRLSPVSGALPAQRYGAGPGSDACMDARAFL